MNLREDSCERLRRNGRWSLFGNFSALRNWESGASPIEPFQYVTSLICHSNVAPESAAVMGAAASVKYWKRAEPMTVDPPSIFHSRVPQFARQIFKKYEWETLKAFCQKYSIAQKDLVRVFRKYLSGDEAFLREFRVKTSEPRSKFANHSRLIQEIADVFIPSTYLKEFAGLQAMDSNEECSFARFIIISYILGCQHFCDLIYDFIAILRQKLTLQLTVVIATYSVSKLCTILMEEFQPSGTLRILKLALKKLEEAPDMRFHSVICLGIKYPLLFYSLERFRKFYKRAVFGDKFWQGRKFLKIRAVKAELYQDDDFLTFFGTEEIAKQRTARSIIADCLHIKVSTWTMTDTFYSSPSVLTRENMTTLKRILGYKGARDVVLDSTIAYDHNADFLQPFLLQAPVSSPPFLSLPNSPWQDEDQSPLEDETFSRPVSPSGAPGLTYDVHGYSLDANPQQEGNNHALDEGDAQDAYLRQQLAGDQQKDPPDREGVAVVHEANYDRDFRYDVKTGRSRWQQLFIDSDGDIVREIYF